MWNFGNSSIPAFPQAATESKDSSVFIARPGTTPLAPNGRLAPLQCSAGRGGSRVTEESLDSEACLWRGGSRPWEPSNQKYGKSLTFDGEPNHKT